jgi:hypothetical protein
VSGEIEVGKLLVEAMICPRCDHIDDLLPDPGSGASRRCPCPHDELTAQMRVHQAADQHAVAVARAARTERTRRAS